MASRAVNKKRKIPAEVEENEGILAKVVQNGAADVGSDDEDDELAFLNKGGLLDARQSDDEGGDSEDDEEEDEDGEDESEYDSDDYSGEDEAEEEDLDSDEIPFDDEESTAVTKKMKNASIQATEGEEEIARYSDLDEDLPPGTRVVMDSAGNPRYLYPEIVPNYDSDDTDAGKEENVIGNIPFSTYDLFPHIGYDINGNKIMRPAAGKALDELLDSIELPKGWTGLVDKNTGKELKLSDEELRIVSQIQRGKLADELEDKDLEYAPTVEWFSSKTEIMPLSSAPEPKRRFVPSKHEANRVGFLTPGLLWLVMRMLIVSHRS